MRRSMLLTLALLALLALWSAAASRAAEAGRQAVDATQPPAPTCKPRVLENDGAVDISAGAWNATCVPGRGCSLSGPEANGARLQLVRQVGEKGWRLVLGLPVAADVMAGLQLALDGGAAENLPGEFLQEQAEGRAIALRPEVAGVVLEMLTGAKRQATWHYTTKGGEARRFSFPVACLPVVLKAAQQRLATMRAMKQLGK